MNRTNFLVLCFCLISQFTFSQSADRNLFLELGGPGGIWSINKESSLDRFASIPLSYRIGVGASPIDRNNGILLVFPLSLQYMVGTKHQVETYLGHNISVTTKASFHPQILLGLGYRYNPPDKKLFFRFTYSPFLSYLIDLQYQNWFGVSVGYHLNKKK